MFVLIIICSLNLAWWGFAAFICRCDMEEAWMCYHYTHNEKHLKRVEGFEKRLVRIHKWVIGWLSATCVSVLLWNLYS